MNSRFWQRIESCVACWMRTRRAAQRAMAILLFILATAVPFCAADFGSAWDDAVQQEYGARSLRFFASFGSDRSANELLDLKYYGPLLEMLIAGANRCLPGQQVFLRHVIAASLALLAAPALYRLGRMLGNRWIGVAATLFLLLMPRFCGDAFVNTKDVPFAVGMAASISLLTAMFTRGRFSWREIVFSGLAIGLTLAIRPGGALLLGAFYFLLTFFVDWQNWRRSTEAQEPHSNRSSRSLAKQFALLAIAWCVMVLPWPWALESPLEHPLQAIRMASRFHLVIPVLFEGTFYPSNELPRYYLLRWLLMTVPLATMMLATIGILAGGWQLIQQPLSRRARVLMMILAWPIVPLILFAVMRPNAYDGMRHFLFVLPPLALWAAFGTWSLFKLLQSSSVCRTSLALGLMAIFAGQAATIVRWHPYQGTYFNVLAGRSGLERTYETDYWLLSYKEAMEWIRQQPAVAGEAHRPIRVLVAANDQSLACAANFAGPRIEVTRTLDAAQGGDLPAGFDYYVGTTRGGMAYNYPDAPVACLIERPGFTLAAIKRRASPSNTTIKKSQE